MLHHLLHIGTSSSGDLEMVKRSTGGWRTCFMSQTAQIYALLPKPHSLCTWEPLS